MSSPVLRRITRRQFVRTLGCGLAAGATGGFSSRLLASDTVPGKGRSVEPRALILIHLEGGNDGLNTFIPLQDDRYHRLRPGLAVARSDAIVLSHSWALNCSGGGLEALFKDGRLAVVQNVGYSGQSPSHFRSSEVWHTASEADEVLYSGWVGRCLSRLQAESRVVTAFHGGRRRPRILVCDEDRPHGPQALAKDCRVILGHACETPAVQLAEIGERAAAGAGTEVYFVTVPGFDTHFCQAGAHCRQLELVANALLALQRRLERRGVDGRVLTVAFSEFGRSLAGNSQGGTDHGGGGPVMLLGTPVRGGIYDHGPGLPDGSTASLDFRRVLATVMDQWLAVPARDILGRDFEPLALLCDRIRLNATT